MGKVMEWVSGGKPVHTYTDLSHSVHLKCSEPFLETRGWLDGGDSPSLCPLTVGCSDVAKRGGCGRAWDYPRWAAGSKEEARVLTS